MRTNILHILLWVDITNYHNQDKDINTNKIFAYLHGRTRVHQIINRLRLYFNLY